MQTTDTCTHIHIHIIYIYIIMGRGISPPAFRDIFKFHELRQFRVKGLGYIGYMSSGLRVPNFPNSAEPDGLRPFGNLGNWEGLLIVCFSSVCHLLVVCLLLAHCHPADILPTRSWAFSRITTGVFLLTWIFACDMNTGAAGPLNNCLFPALDSCTCTHFPISQFPK